MGSPLDLVVHADWGRLDQKRRMARAVRTGSTYTVLASEPVGGQGDLLGRLGISADASAVIGFDFPIGVPVAYARAAGIENFRNSLPLFGEGEWADFYHGATTADEISLHRPFYPKRNGPKGSQLQRHLWTGLGVTAEEALRRCERAGKDRSAACCLFWTLGGNQVGKGARTGWELIAPLLANDTAVGLWPFDGEFGRLIEDKRIVIVETYPAQYHKRLALPRPGRRWSKRSQDDRRRLLAPALHEAIASLDADEDESLALQIEDGFGPRKDGEDRFDAVVGLLGMLAAIKAPHGVPIPDDVAVRDVEGWIFGQAPSA